MGITIYKSIALIEDYYKWKKKFGFDGSEIDDATKKLLEVAKKYQKIREIAEQLKGLSIDEMSYVEFRIREILDGNDD